MKNGYEFVALFNNDAVADKNWLKNLLGAAQKHSKAGIVTGKFMRSDKKHIDSTADMLSIYGLPFPRGRNELDTGQYDNGEYIFGATGGASLYRMSMFYKIGLFDEDFFAYFEDVDISFRAQSAGWKVYYEPTAVAYHKIGATSSKMGSFPRYHSVKNLILLYNRNMPGLLFWKYKLRLLSQVARMFFGSLRDRQLGAFFHSLWTAFLLIPKTLWVRHKNKTLRTVPVSKIDSLLYHGRPPRPPKLTEKI
jgi:GT2 family glycosyltransferase